MIDWTQPAAAILSQLLEIVERRRPISESWATGARGLRDFGPGSSGWGGMVAKLRQIGFADVADQMVSGMDFGDPQVQTMLTQLGMIEPDTFTDERVEIMKDWGVEARPRWTLEGFTTQPTIQDVDKRKSDESEKIHRQKARTAGAQFGEAYKHGDDAGAVMSNIWSAISGN
jgi:hypothetical protein